MTTTVEPFWERVTTNSPILRQGDYLPNCYVARFAPNFEESQELPTVDVEIFDLIVLTQSCDLDNGKTRFVALCPIYPISQFERVNPAFQKKGRWEEVRKGRVEGLLLLASPDNPENNQESLVVDFREIHSLPFDYLITHTSNIENRWRLKSPYLEHFSQAFARCFMRVGLPSAIPPFK